MGNPKYAIVYLTLDMEYAKQNNLPIKLPLLLEDFQKGVEKDNIPLDFILNGLEAQYKTDKEDTYYATYLVYFYYEKLKNLLTSKEPFSYKDGELLLDMAKSVLYDYRNHFYRGMLLKRFNEIELAELELKKAISMNHDFSLGYYELGNLMFERGIDDEAVQNYLECINHNKDFILAYLKLSDVYIEDGRFEEAFNYLKLCLEIDNTFTAAYLRIGVLFNQLQRYNDANKAFTEGLRYEPQNFEILYNQAYTLARLARHTDALVSIKKAVEANNSDIMLHELSVEFKNLGMYLEALDAELNAYKISGEENKRLLELTLIKLAVLTENEDLLEEMYKKLVDSEYEPSARIFKMFYLIGSGQIEEVMKELSVINNEGYFLSLPERIENIESIIEKLEFNTDKRVESALLDSFDDNGLLVQIRLANNLKKYGLSGEYIGWIKEKDTFAKDRPNGLELFTNALLMCGLNYGLAERIVTTLARFVWKDGKGIAFARLLLRFYQDRVFAENSSIENFIDQIIEEIKDLDFISAGLLAGYEEKILDFDELSLFKINSFEDMVTAFISGFRLEYTIEDIENEEFKDSRVKELLRFMSVMNYL